MGPSFPVILATILLIALVLPTPLAFGFSTLGQYSSVSRSRYSFCASRLHYTTPTRMNAQSRDGEASSSSTPRPLLISLVQHLKQSTGTTSATNDNDGNDKIQFVLASQSPRRREILDMMGLQHRFLAQPSPLDESAVQAELMAQGYHDQPKEYTIRLAQEKAMALAQEQVHAAQSLPTIYLGSDTIVDLEGHILEKPQNTSEAIDMLTRLSGKTHQVHTGVALVLANHPTKSSTPILVDSFVETANVTFASLSSTDIEAYVATQEPLDKAGSYGIQGIGGQLVSEIQGDFFAVMGLPMHRTSRALAKVIQEIVSSLNAKE